MDSRVATSKQKLKYKPFSSRVQLSIIYIFHSFYIRIKEAFMEQCLIDNKICSEKNRSRTIRKDSRKQEKKSRKEKKRL